MIFKKVLELANIRVFDTFVNPDLGHQLLFGSSFGKGGFLNEFAGKNRFCLVADKLVTLGESTFSEELALVVVSNPYAAVFLFEFFFDNCVSGLTVHFKFYFKFADLVNGVLGFWGD